MQLECLSFADNTLIPADYALCRLDASGRPGFSANRNPELRWQEIPQGTRSFALICCDPDAPTSAKDVNREDRTVAAGAPRSNFYHWVLVDIPSGCRSLAAGEFSSGVTARGKPSLGAPQSGRPGINSYTDWFADDAAMAGEYYGYDGPCPPWNDERLHRYVFTLYALSIPHCPVTGPFTGSQVETAVETHVLASASLTGIYTLNQRLLGG